MSITEPPSRPRAIWRKLIWLKWVLTMRGYRRDSMKAAGAVIALIVLAPLSIMYACGAYYLAVHAHEYSGAVFNAVLGGVFLLWIVTPLIGFTLNESYDPTRLFVYPITYRTIFACAVAGGILDYTMLLLIPIAAALAAAASHTFCGAILSAILIVLFVAQTLATSQALLLAMLGLLRSRRFRDLTIVLVPLLGLAWYMGQNALLQSNAGNMHALLGALLHNAPLTFMSYLPSGWAARGLHSVDQGNFGQAGLWCLALAGILGAMLLAGGWVMRGLALGRGGADAASGPASPAAIPVVGMAPTLPRQRTERPGILPPAVIAVCIKEWRYLTRDPMYKAMFVQMIYMLAIVVMPQFAFSHGSGTPFAGRHGVGLVMREALPFALTVLVPTAFMRLVFNIFGGEGSSISIFLSFPTPRRQVFAGKNLAHATVLVPVLMAIMIGACIVFQVPGMIGLGMLWVVIEAATMIGIGVVVSVLLPNKFFVRGMGYQSPGCSYFLLQLLASIVALLFLIVPAAMIGLSVWLASPVWSAVLLPLAALYAAGVYAGGVAIAVSLIDRMTPAIIARLSANQ